MSITQEVTIDNIPLYVTMSKSEYGSDYDGNRGIVRWELDSVEPVYEEDEDAWKKIDDDDRAFQAAIDSIEDV